MKKNLPTPVVIGVIVAVLLVVGILYWIFQRPAGMDPSVGLPPADAPADWQPGPVEVHGPPSGFSVDGNNSGQSGN